MTAVSGRGFEDYYDEHHDDDHEHTTTAKPMKQSRYTDPWAGYYDWIINEGSFKFWSVFQVSFNIHLKFLPTIFNFCRMSQLIYNSCYNNILYSKYF